MSPPQALTVADCGVAGLDIAGFVPGFGEIADGVNAVIYLAEGRYAEAAISAAAMIPIVGDAGKAAKWGVNSRSQYPVFGSDDSLPFPPSRRQRAGGFGLASVVPEAWNVGCPSRRRLCHCARAGWI